MSCGDDQRPTVLIVDDEPELLGLYQHFLEDRYSVRTADGGEAALDRMSAAVDVVLLDRRMPTMSGDEVLHELRQRGYDCPVAMVTAVEPEVDIADLPFDDYLVKPVSAGELEDVITRLYRWWSYETEIREHFSLAARIATLETSQSETDLSASPEYQDLLSEFEDSRDRVQSRLTSMSIDEIDNLLRNFNADRIRDAPND